MRSYHSFFREYDLLLVSARVLEAFHFPCFLSISFDLLYFRLSSLVVLVFFIHNYVHWKCQGSISSVLLRLYNGSFYYDANFDKQ